MPIDPNAVGAEGGPVERSWTSKDCLLYALGVGAGVAELDYATEKSQQVLPTFAVIFILGDGFTSFVRLVTAKFGLAFLGQLLTAAYITLSTIVFLAMFIEQRLLVRREQV